MKELERLNLRLFDGEGGGDGGGETGAEAAAAEPTETGSAPEEGVKNEGVPVTSDTLEERKAAFRDLINGEYKELYQQELQQHLDRRMRKSRGLEAKLAEHQPVIDMLMERYGVTDGNMATLQAAIENDDGYWETAAEDAGMSVDQYKEFSRMRRENEQFHQAEEQRQRSQQVQNQLQAWYQQAEEAKGAYPGLDLQVESQNPRFMAMLKSGVPVQTAYEVIHMDQIKAGVYQNAAATTQKKVTDNVRARGARPAENGTSANSGFTVKNDVSKLSKAERAELAKRASRGEKITFSR